MGRGFIVSMRETGQARACQVGAKIVLCIDTNFGKEWIAGVVQLYYENGVCMWVDDADSEIFPDLGLRKYL